MILELGIICLTLVIWYVVKTRRELAGAPPGGFPLPIIGNLYQFTWQKLVQRKLVPIIMHEYTQKYGPISRLQFGLQRHLIIEDYDLMKEILCSEHWTSRHFDEWFGERSFGKPYGLLFSEGEEWREMRRFTLRTLRDFGFGKYSTQEGVAEEELNELISRLNAKMEKNGNIIYMKQFFTISVLNILWSMVTGIRFSHDDDKLKRFNRTTFKVVKIASVGDNMANAFPILRHLYTPFVKDSVEEMQEYFREMLREKREQQDYKNDQRDFVEVFLKEMDNHKDKTPNYYSEEQFIVLILDLFMAGSETTSNTLEFAMLYMMLYPEVQRKVQQEIDTVIGTNRFPTAADRAKMTYTEATILELQRITNVVPVDGRTNTQDYKLGPYNIPKGNLAVLNLYSMHMNPETWPEPRQFKPERFLDSDNKLINAHKILPFGLGKRVCIGEPMARFTIFVYFTALLQKYTFSKVPGKPAPSPLEPLTGVTLSPQPYSTLITPRQ